jgi:hypothetical protein
MAEVIIDVRGQDNFSGVLGNLGNIVTGIKSAVDLMGMAWTAAANAIQPFIDSASESQQAVFELEAVLRATGGAAGLTSEELQGMADGLQNMTRFSDEAILGGQSMLLTFRNIGEDTFPRATEAMLDMATMFGSIDSAAVQLGKALNDPIAGISALQRIGIQFTDEQKEMIQNFMDVGDVASAQNIILKEVEMQIGGLAIAMGETFAGKIDILKNKLDSLKELIGGPIIAVLGELAGAFMEKFDALVDSEWPPIKILENLNDNLNEGMPILQAFGFAFKDLFELTPEEEALFDSIGGFFLTFQSALDNSQGPLQAFTTALDFLVRDDGPLSGLAANILSVITAFETGGFINAADTLVANLITEITTKINNWVNGDGPGRLTEAIISWVDDIGTGTGFTSKALTAAGNLLYELSEAIKEVDWAKIATTMDEKLADGIDEEEWEKSGAEFAKGVRELFENVNSILSGESVPVPIKPSLIVPTPGDNPQWIQDIITGIHNWLGGFIGEIDWDAPIKPELVAPGQEEFDEMWGRIQTWWSENVADLFAPISPDLIVPDGSQFIEDMRQIGADAWEGLRVGFTRMSWDAKVWIDEKIVQPIKDFLGIASPSTVFAGIGGDIIDGLLNGLKSGWSSVTTWFTTKFTNLLENLTWDNIIAVISGNMSISELFGGSGGTSGYSTGGGLAGGTGSVGGRDMGGTLTGTTTNTFNFYGTVYMNGVGPEGTFDCPSPHPIMIASSQSLLTPGVA